MTARDWLRRLKYATVLTAVCLAAKAVILGLAAAGVPTP